MTVSDQESLGAGPGYYGMMGSWLYEVIWIWKDGRWVFDKSEGPYYQSVMPIDQCGALNPLGMEPNFFWKPPYRYYIAYVYSSITGGWYDCAKVKNF
jgi:hypothetical protein